MTPEQLRLLAERALQLQAQVDTMSKKIHRIETVNEQLTHEIAILKRHKFAKRSEQISPAQGSLLDDLLNTDLEAIEAELKALHPAPAQVEPRQQPRRAPLPPQLPRTVIHHEPDNTQCTCGCQLQRIGEDVSEKLDYAPEPGLIFLTVDPASDIFRANQEASLERMFAHELHHAARWAGPGYGSSLGEALVSEGLAGAFAQEICGGLPEP